MSDSARKRDSELIAAIHTLIDENWSWWMPEARPMLCEKIIAAVRSTQAEPTHWRVIARDTGNIKPLNYRQARNVSTQLQSLFYKHYPNSHGGYAAITESTAIFDNDLQARRQATMCRNLGADVTLTPMTLVEVSE